MYVHHICAESNMVLFATLHSSVSVNTRRIENPAYSVQVAPDFPIQVPGPSLFSVVCAPLNRL